MDERASASRRKTDDTSWSMAGESTLDDLLLAALGATEVDPGAVLPLTDIWALQHKSETPDPMDHQRNLFFESVSRALTPRRPRTVVLGYGAGDALFTPGEMLQIG
ncbi:unnamed protein product, partial [Ectocarpus sp. 13 AM-2016]